jgi:hypothetical protein
MFVCNLNVEYHIHKSPRCRCEVSVHAMKPYRGSRGIFPLIFNLDTDGGQRSTSQLATLNPAKHHSYPLDRRLVFTFWRRGKSLAPTRNEPQIIQPVA